MKFKLTFLSLISTLLLLQSTIVAQEKTISERPDVQNSNNQAVFSEVNSKVVPQEQADLAMFINKVLLNNIELRKKNSQKLFIKLVNKQETGLLPIEVYKSLGVRLRDPFLVQIPEISTRFYNTDDDSNLYFQQLFDLEKTWALLSTTFSRISQKDNFSTLIEQNVALDSVDLWYRMTNNQQYNQWLIELSNQIKIAGKAQFFDTEAAYLFARTGTRRLPENRKKTVYNFAQLAICSPNIELSQIGTLYLKTNHPDVLDVMDHESLRQQIWNLSQNAREFSKKLLLDPENQQLKAVNYVLSDFTLNLILQLNHKRLNAFSENQNNFFVKQNNNVFTDESLSRLTEFINFQNEAYGLKVLDAFVAAERVASLNLQLFRGCVQLYDDKQNTKSFAQAAESQHFFGLNFPVATNVPGAINKLVKNWDGSSYSIIASQPEVSVLPVSNNQKIPPSFSSPALQDSIISANSEQAAKLLKKEGFVLSGYDEIINLTNDRGYSIQILTTSSASEAAAKALLLSKSEQVKVYLSSVKIDGIVEKRYKVLVTFLSGSVSDEKTDELKIKAEQLKGFLKPYRSIRKDLVR